MFSFLLPVLLVVYFPTVCRKIHERGSTVQLIKLWTLQAVKCFGGGRGCPLIFWCSEFDPIKRSAFHLSFFLKTENSTLMWLLTFSREKLELEMQHCIYFYLNTYFIELWRYPSSRANIAWREHKRLYVQERKVHCGSRET